jgi:uncharacterized membrane protein (TIGR02234 family)
LSSSTEPTEATEPTSRLRALTARRTVVVVGLLGAGVVLLGVSRPWGTVDVQGLASFGDIKISGSHAAPAGTAVALAVAAAALVLTIAGRVVRFLIPVGLLIAGVALAYSGLATMHQPHAAAADALRDTLSLGGGNMAQGFDFTTSLGGWGWIYVVGAVVIALGGVLGILGSRSWPVSGRRFERAGRAAPNRPVAPVTVGGWSSSADVWDAQNRGEDLTSGPDPLLADSSPGASSSDSGSGGGDSGGGGGGD